MIHSIKARRSFENQLLKCRDPKYRHWHQQYIVRRRPIYFHDYLKSRLKYRTISKIYKLSRSISSNLFILFFWFIYLFNLFIFLLPNIMMKKLLDLTNVYLYHNANKHHFYFRLGNLYSYKGINYLIYDNLIYDKNVNGFANWLLFCFSFDQFVFRGRLMQLYRLFSFKLFNKLLRFRFLFNLAGTLYKRKLKIKKLLRRKKRRYIRKFNIRFLRKFKKRRISKKKFFRRRKYIKGKLVRRKRIKKKRRYKQNLKIR